MTATPTDTEITLARAFLALLRTHEEAGDPATWWLSPDDWGDGRTTYMLRDRDPVRGTTGLVCQFRPDDADGTAELAEACVAAVQLGLTLSAKVLAAAAMGQGLAARRTVIASMIETAKIDPRTGSAEFDIKSAVDALYPHATKADIERIGQQTGVVAVTLLTREGGCTLDQICTAIVDVIAADAAAGAN
jgi:hypothetical protein